MPGDDFGFSGDFGGGNFSLPDPSFDFSNLLDFNFGSPLGGFDLPPLPESSSFAFPNFPNVATPDFPLGAALPNFNLSPAPQFGAPQTSLGVSNPFAEGSPFGADFGAATALPTTSAFGPLGTGGEMGDTGLIGEPGVSDEAARNFLAAQTQTVPSGTPQPPAGPPIPWDPRTWDARTWALALGLGASGVGIIGLIQRMMQGDAAARQTLTRVYNEASPEEKAAIANALQQYQRLTQSPTGGINPLDPAVARLVEQAFQPQMGNITEQAIEQARRQGFHDNPLTSPVGGALAGRPLADLQGQMAAAKLGLSQQMAQNQLSGLQGIGGLLGALQGTRGFQQTGQGPGATLADTFDPLSRILVGLSSILGQYGLTAPKRL